MRVALLSGGTGGAKLARGLLDVVGADGLTVIANTGDDAEVYGVQVAPDPDLVTYWLADAIDERGYGIRDDSWSVMEALAAAGQPTWFGLGDRDLAMCLVRTERLRAGERLTDAHAAVVEAMGVGARVLPMCDEPAPTRIAVRGRVLAFQEFMIVEGARGPLAGVGLLGAEPGTGREPAVPSPGTRRPTPEVLAALRTADAIVIGPSNPIVSIGPILALHGLRAALGVAPAPIVAVSPFVGGEVLKGPTRLFCEHAGVEPTAAGIASHYGDLVDGVVADEPVEGLPGAVCDTLLDTPAARADVARRVLALAADIAASSAR